MPKNGKRPEFPLWVSQNYLTSSGTIRRILDRTTLTERDTVLEIGPGKGHITRQLLARCGRVIAVELDPKNILSLRRKFPDCPRLKLVQGDFLTWPLPRSAPYKVFSNIPFHITTQILRKLTEAPHPPEELWLVLEKGACKRFLGRPRESLRSLLLKPWFEGELLYHFSPQDFHPSPRTEVVLLHLRRRERPHLAEVQRQAYRTFVTRCLQGEGLGRQFSRGQLKAALREAGLPRDFLLGEIKYVQWLCLFRCYWTHVLGKKLPVDFSSPL